MQQFKEDAKLGEVFSFPSGVMFPFLEDSGGDSDSPVAAFCRLEFEVDIAKNVVC